jgi:hypothetical protein
VGEAQEKVKAKQADLDKAEQDEHKAMLRQSKRKKSATS